MYWPYLALIALFLVFTLYMRRKRAAQASAENDRLAGIGVGAEVMTTSGLYGTVVEKNDEDGTVALAVAPGVELKWALAALRTAEALPAQYRRGIPPPLDAEEDPTGLDDPDRAAPIDLQKRLQPPDPA